MQGGCFALLTHGLDDHSLGALAVPLPIENSLPGTQIELTGSHGDDDLMANG